MSAPGEIVDAADDDQLRAGQPDGAVEGAASAQHHDFVLHAGGVGQLPDLVRIGAGHAARRRRGHRSGGAGGDHAGFGARQLGQFSSGGLLQFEDVDEVLRRVVHGAADLGQFQRAAQIGPRPARVDEGANAEAPIDVARGRGAGCGGQRIRCRSRGDHAVDWSGRHPFQPASTIHGVTSHMAASSYLRAWPLALIPYPFLFWVVLLASAALPVALISQAPCEVTLPTASLSVPHVTGEPALDADPNAQRVDERRHGEDRQGLFAQDGLPGPRYDGPQGSGPIVPSICCSRARTDR